MSNNAGSSGSGSSGSGGGTGYGGGGMAPPPPPSGSSYSMTSLISDGSVAAVSSDTNLTDPWGLVFAPNAAVRVANHDSQTSTTYDGDGKKLQPVVAIPAGLNGAANPTGVVFNGGSGFVVTKGTASGPAQFIFAGLAGTISGFAQSVDAQNAITAYDDGAGGAMYTGLAIATASGGAVQLYAADFHNNKVDVFDSSFHKVTVAGGFTDSTLPQGYAPFGIQAITSATGTLIYVTYAKPQTPANGESEPGAGFGLLDVFDTEGNLKTHLIPTGGHLNAPWGLALAPASFGTFSNDLLVGNFGDGTINAFDPSTGAYVGTIEDANGGAITNAGLWGIAFGNGAESQPTTTLFFTAGIGGGSDGLYGRIDLGATPPSLTPPSVSISAPANGATVSGTVTVTATATDSAGIASVKLLAGTTVLATLTSSPYTTSWNTTGAANGSVTLTAQATDRTGNTATSAPVTVTVNNVAQATVTLTELQETIFTPICSVCHTGEGTSLPGVMNLTAGHAYASLVNVASIEQPDVKRVAPGDPTGSYIIQKLEGASTISGSRMPLGGPYLDQATIDKVSTWISQGAQNN
jgi:uncharacterized protein (TIGR03118 family)